MFTGKRGASASAPQAPAAVQPAPQSALPVPAPIRGNVELADSDLQGLDFEETTPAAADAQGAAAKALRGSADIFKWPEGRTVFRVLPGRKGSPTPYQMVMEHFYYNDADAPVGYACPRHHANRGCSDCVNAAKYLATGNGADFERGEDIQAKLVCYANVLVELAPGQWAVKPARIPGGVHKALLDYVSTAGVDPAHPLNGVFFIAHKTGSGMGTRYTITPDIARGRCPIAPTKDEVADILDSRSDLSKRMFVPSDEDIDKKRKAAKGDNKGGQGGRQLGSGR